MGNKLFISALLSACSANVVLASNEYQVFELVEGPVNHQYSDRFSENRAEFKYIPAQLNLQSIELSMKENRGVVYFPSTKGKGLLKGYIEETDRHTSKEAVVHFGRIVKGEKNEVIGTFQYAQHANSSPYIFVN